MRIPGLPFELTRRHVQHAGRARTRTAADLVDFLQDMPSAEVDRVKRLLGAATIAGASAQYILQTVSPSALSASLTTTIGPLVGLGQSPLVLGLCFYPTITGASAAATATFNLRRTDTPAVIGSQSFLTATADTNPRGPIVFAAVPFGIPATSGIDFQGSVSTGAGTLTCSTTTPGILAALGIT